ncbi:MAG: MFS transporter [Alphaproteobacteria bacterium]|nr:MFS transporter [Alphaproteobacteria bacterium]MBU0793546.1 MFS transporter [Alphaproteobacteria bacterium]MBU0876396.1 MFS transporter [Alphaproteobacteria bacterium]MBU1770947.1 MFS transporter [Alphaproteobacteria bacterium]
MSEDGRPSIATMRRYTWMNILTGFLVWGVALAGVSMMMPIMYGTISQDMGWTISQTTSFMAIKSAVSGIAGLFAGGLIVKFGLKRVFVQSVVVIGLATLGLYFVSNLPIFYALAAVSGLASILALIAVQVTLAKWHSASIGRITGVAMLGGAVAGAIVPLATAFGLQNFGWHVTAAAAGVLVLTVVLGAAIFLFREAPEAYGYTADELDPGPAGGKRKVSGAMATDAGPEFRSIFKTRQFILLIIAATLSGAISNGVNEYIPLFVERQANLGAYMAALGFTIVLVISGLGKILFGWVFDRFSTKGVAACWALCGVAVLLSFPVAGLVTFLIFMLVRGVSHGGVVVQAPVLARHLYGIKPIAQVIALLNAAFHMGSALGIWAIGIGVDLTGGFGIPFTAVALTAGVCALIGLRLEPRYWAGYTAPRTPAHAGG